MLDRTDEIVYYVQDNNLHLEVEMKKLSVVPVPTKKLHELLLCLVEGEATSKAIRLKVAEKCEPHKIDPDALISILEEQSAILFDLGQGDSYAAQRRQVDAAEQLSHFMDLSNDAPLTVLQMIVHGKGKVTTNLCTYCYLVAGVLLFLAGVGAISWLCFDHHAHHWFGMFERGHFGLALGSLIGSVVVWLSIVYSFLSSYDYRSSYVRIRSDYEELLAYVETCIKEMDEIMHTPVLETVPLSELVNS